MSDPTRPPAQEQAAEIPEEESGAAPEGSAEVGATPSSPARSGISSVLTAFREHPWLRRGMIIGVVTCLLCVCVGVGAARAYGTEVVRVIDGDTLEVKDLWQRQQTVRLLNVDAPETKHPNRIVECYGPEAAEFLAKLLPPGTKVQLSYDMETTDEYGRTLAVVYVDGKSVNVELAAQGLAAPVSFGDNVSFLPEVQAAADEAKRKGLGIYGVGKDCTISQVTAALAPLASQVAAVDVAALDEAGTQAASDSLAQTLTALTALKAGLSATAAPEQFLSALRKAMPDVPSEVDRAISSARNKISAADQRHTKLVEERKAREEAERKAREEAERREREAAAAAEAARQAAIAQQQRYQQQYDYDDPNPPGSSSGGVGGGGHDGYTGCRAYGGGFPPNAIDSKGRPYTKIDCTTKAIIP